MPPTMAEPLVSDLQQEASDADLMARVRAGDREAFTDLVERHKDAVVNYLTRLTGSRDDLLYGANRTLPPDSSGLTLQLDGTPFGGGNSPLGKRFNMRVGVQYTNYFAFDGSGRNYDGLGRNAADNNTLRVFTWIAY